VGRVERERNGERVRERGAGRGEGKKEQKLTLESAGKR